MKLRTILQSLLREQDEAVKASDIKGLIRKALAEFQPQLGDEYKQYDYQTMAKIFDKLVPVNQLDVNYLKAYKVALDKLPDLAQKVKTKDWSSISNELRSSFSPDEVMHADFSKDLIVGFLMSIIPDVDKKSFSMAVSK